MVAAGFTPGEADALRRSMATWKRMGGIEPPTPSFVDPRIHEDKRCAGRAGRWSGGPGGGGTSASGPGRARGPAEARASTDSGRAAGSRAG
jgi:hypothetical protein